MAKYHVTMTQRTTWEFEVEADNEEAALEQTREWGRDEMVDEEITDNCWDVTVS